MGGDKDAKAEQVVLEKCLPHLEKADMLRALDLSDGAPSPLAYLRNADSICTTSSEESLKLLLDAHFPLNRSAEEGLLVELRKGCTAFSYHINHGRLSHLNYLTLQFSRRVEL